MKYVKITGVDKEKLEVREGILNFRINVEGKGKQKKSKRIYTFNSSVKKGLETKCNIFYVIIM